jgi:hypothetical protein
VTPVAAVGATIADALRALRADLEMHRRKAAELDSIIARLNAYAGKQVKRKRRRRVGRPSIADEARRERTRLAMRKRRAKLKAAAAPLAKPPAPSPDDTAHRAQKAEAQRARRQKLKDAAAAAKPEPKPAKPKARKKAGKPDEETDSAPLANGGSKQRGRPAFSVSGEKLEASPWVTGSDGTLSRELIAPGSHIPLKDERTGVARS